MSERPKPTPDRKILSDRFNELLEDGNDPLEALREVQRLAEKEGWTVELNGLQFIIDRVKRMRR